MQQPGQTAVSSTDQALGRGSGGETAVIHQQGDHWTLVYGGSVSRLRDTRGLRLLRYLLMRPGEEISALRLELLTVPEAAPARIGPLAVERARINVTRSLRGVLDRIRPAQRDLYLHLRATLRTGGNCRYAPDMSVPIRWTTSWPREDSPNAVPERAE